MTDGDRALIGVSAALASADEGALANALSHARGVAEDSEVEEVLLQSYLFLGFPASLNGMATWRRSTGRGPTEPAPPDYASWEGRGRDVCAAVYSGQYERVRENVRALHPDLEQWMVVEAALREAERFCDDEGRRAAAVLWEKVRRRYPE